LEPERDELERAELDREEPERDPLDRLEPDFAELDFAALDRPPDREEPDPLLDREEPERDPLDRDEPDRERDELEPEDEPERDDDARERDEDDPLPDPLREELLDDDLRELDRRRDVPPLRSAAGISSRATAFASCSICFSRNFAIRSSSRRIERASFAVSLSPTVSASDSMPA
jgi:hypothetical protein